MNIRKIEAQPTEKKKLRVAAYCRVSTEQDEQKESLETQKTHYESWIKLHSDWEFAGIFYDFGITGTKAEVRDGLQALLYECRIGRKIIFSGFISPCAHFSFIILMANSSNIHERFAMPYFSKIHFNKSIAIFINKNSGLWFY